MIAQIISGLVTRKLCKRISGHDVWVAAHIPPERDAVSQPSAFGSAEFYPLVYDINRPRLGG